MRAESLRVLRVFQSLATANQKTLCPKTVQTDSLLGIKLRAEWERCNREKM